MKKRFRTIAFLPLLLWGAEGVAASPEEALSPLLGISYRLDGAIDETGRFTLFADPQQTFSQAGLNCSGFVVQAGRILLKNNLSLAAASRDRLNDSGPGAPDGHDWDFGWDLIMNISEGLPRQMLLPQGESLDPALASGHAPRGFDLHAPETWTELQSRLQPGYVYLLSFNKEVRGRGNPLRHYHVGLLLPDAAGAVWLYQTTPESRKVTRRNLMLDHMRAEFLRSFANTGKVRKKMIVIEVKLPES